MEREGDFFLVEWTSETRRDREKLSSTRQTDFSNPFFLCVVGFFADSRS